MLIWNTDLTGVGALIAIGSQEDIGNCALLVIATTHIILPKPLIDPETILMLLEPTICAKKIKRQISPTRLDINVRIAVLTRTKTSINRMIQW